MRRAAAAFTLLLGLAGCLAEPAAAPPLPERPLRVVSLDYCADQYVLELLPTSRILALSPDADAPFSYKRTAAAGVRQVRPRAEDVLVLRPGLVVRTYGGGPDAARFFAAAGVPVLEIGSAEDLAGVRRVLIEAARGLGEEARGAALAARMAVRLAALRAAPGEAEVLYMTSGGVTSGPGSLVHAMIEAAGLGNYQAEPGWRPLPLERLARERPELVATAFYGEGTARLDPWSAARHPIARAQLEGRPVVPLDAAWTACGGWFVLDAIEALARAGR